MMFKKLGHAQRKAKQIAQISMDVEKSWDQMRLCLTNGYFLCSDTLGPRLIESIMVFGIEQLLVASVEGQRACTSDNVAELIVAVEKPADRVMRLAELKRELQNPTTFQKRLKEARKLPVTPHEATKWINIPVRRCPSCLLANPAACARCLTCNAVYRGEAVVRDTPQQAEPQPQFRSTYIKVGTQPWDVDDEVAIPWQIQPTISSLRPMKFSESLSVIPPFNLRHLQGMRN